MFMASCLCFIALRIKLNVYGKKLAYNVGPQYKIDRLHHQCFQNSRPRTYTNRLTRASFYRKNLNQVDSCLVYFVGPRSWFSPFASWKHFQVKSSGFVALIADSLQSLLFLSVSPFLVLDRGEPIRFFLFQSYFIYVDRYSFCIFSLLGSLRSTTRL